MKRKRILCWGWLVVLATGLMVGCSGDPGQAVPATQQETENDPALKEPGGV